MGVIAWIILGVVAGMVSRSLLRDGDSHGLVIATVIGVTGALLGGFLAAELFDIRANRDFFNLTTWIVAIVGAAALLSAYHVATGQNSGRWLSRWIGR